MKNSLEEHEEIKKKIKENQKKLIPYYGNNDINGIVDLVRVNASGIIYKPEFFKHYSGSTLWASLNKYASELEDLVKRHGLDRNQEKQIRR